jgi:TonB family protein
MSAELLAGNIAAHWLQAGTLAASALGAIRLLNLNEPRSRLAALQLVPTAILLLPLMQPWRPEAPAQQMTIFATATKFFATTTVDASAVISETYAADAAPWIDPAVGIVAILAAGMATRLLWLFYGVVRLVRFSRRCSPVSPPFVAGALEAELAVSPRYIQEAGSRGPWTFGFVRPTVALPVGFDALIPAFQRSVICHELVHVKRRDMAVAFCEELVVAALWFHPWMWLLRARIRVAREQVVDSRVVSMLGNRDEYVRCLVDISGHDLAPHYSRAGAGMLRPRELRTRVDSIFQEVHMSRTRIAIAAGSFVVVMIGTGLIGAAAMPLRAPASVPTDSSQVVSGFATAEEFAEAPSRTPAVPLRAAQSQTAPAAPRKQINKTYADYPQDALERGIRGTVLVDITVNAAGDVTTAAVVSGPQELRASAFKAALALKYTPGPSTTAMRISIEYTLTGSAWGVRLGTATANGSRGSRATGSLNPPTRGAEHAMPPALRVGGGIRPPRKIKDVPPEYPAAAQEARVQGVVIIEVRLDESGNVSDTRLLRSIPLLDQAATDAVKQWQYTPTLLNGVAVPVLMTVTVNFTLRGEPQVQMRINMPDSTLVLLRTSANGGIGRSEYPAMSQFGFAPIVDKDPSVETVKVAIYEFGQAGDAPRQLGDVELRPNGGMVQSPTTPSFGIELVSVSR